MTRWGLTTIEEPIANLALITGGLGFGLALAPVNAALLASTDDDVHGVASAFVVVARMVGMLIGISALTTIGLRRYYSEQLAVPPVQEVCDGKSGARSSPTCCASQASPRSTRSSGARPGARWSRPSSRSCCSGRCARPGCAARDVFPAAPDGR